MKFSIFAATVVLFSCLTLLPCFVLGQTLLPSDPGAPSSSSEEDYTNASLATSSLHADSPDIVDVSEEATYVREWVTLQWRPNDPIYLFVVRPRGVSKPPVVIYLHDYPAETDIFRDDDWCQRVTAGGYAAAGFVPALNGHRYHGRPMKEWFVSELQESLAMSAHDVQMVVSYLAQRGDVDTSRLGVQGTGAGATIAALAASVDSRIKAVDLVDPWGDWPTWMRMSEVVPEEERPLFLKPKFLKQVAAFDPVVLLPRISAEHVRLVQFGQGSSTPELSRKRMASALPASGTQVRYATSAEFEQADAAGGAGAWIKLQLQPKGSGTNVARKAAKQREAR